MSITRELYPRGRAFKMPVGGAFEKFHKALARSEERAYNDAKSILNSILPDNPNFTADDATDWERRLGLITNDLVSLDTRKLAIIRKMNHPGTIPARNNFRFLEKQLRDSGFDVYVYENRFPDGMGGYETQSPLVITGGVGVRYRQYGQFNYGQQQYGGQYGNIIANYIDEAIDFNFGIGGNLRSTFFISGPYIDEFADVDGNRKQEFRQLILKTKPVQTVGFLLVNYI